MGKAKRYNKDKLRYELISAEGLKKLAEVYTKGAEKYTVYNEDGSIKEDGANNWKLGQNWMGSIASVKRHIEQFVSGEDVDKDLGTLHLANAAWGLFSLMEYYKIYPQGDDRPHKYLNMPRIGLDIDEVIADFTGALMERFPRIKERPRYWNDYGIKDHFDIIKGDYDFWMNIPAKCKELPFEPCCYITTRPIPTDVTSLWLQKNGFPHAEIVTIKEGETKLEAALRLNVEIFVDDRFENFVTLNKGGVCCYLFDTPHNERYNVGHKRIKSLDELV